MNLNASSGFVSKSMATFLIFLVVAAFASWLLFGFLPNYPVMCDSKIETFNDAYIAHTEDTTLPMPKIPDGCVCMSDARVKDQQDNDPKSKSPLPAIAEDARSKLNVACPKQDEVQQESTDATDDDS
jgi:hypothetical protein